MIAQRIAERGRRVWLLSLIAVVGLGVELAAAAAAPAAVPPAPAWAISVISYPTNLVPGSSGSSNGAPGYRLVASNIGGAPTSGTFEVSDELPAGVEFSSPTGAVGTYGGQKTSLSCKIVGATVGCQGGEPSLEPGEAITVRVPVRVSNTAAGEALNQASVEGGGAAIATARVETEITSELPLFSVLPQPGNGVSSFTLADGSSANQAGSHPYEVRTGLGFPIYTYGEFNSVSSIGGGVKDLALDLPRGLMVQPLATATRCTEVQLEQPLVGCPDSSQIGILTVYFSQGEGTVALPLGLFNMVPPGGSGFELGAQVLEGINIHVFGKLRSEDDYGLTATVSDLPAKSPVAGTEIALWGNPTDPSHDHVRGGCLLSGSICPVERSDAAFLTLPTGCAAPLRTFARAESWVDPAATVAAEIGSPTMEGCNRLPFEPALHAHSSTNLADSPAGFEIGVHQPQPEEYPGLAEAALRDATILLPSGLTINPGGADGLSACTPAEVGLRTSPGLTPIRFTAAPVTCPDAAKIGTVEGRTPLVDHPLRGAVYVAEQGRNPFGSLFAIYLTLEDPLSGIVVKLAGEVGADPVDGRLTARFAELPQLPIEDLSASFFSGPRASLRTPALCGSYVTAAELVPWSSPEAVTADRSDSFDLTRAVGGDCPRSEANLPSRASLSAGSATPRAGTYSPFVIRVGREDGTRSLTGIDATLPQGLSASLTAAATCGDAAVASVSCPPGAEVGKVVVTAGPGPSPLHLTGHAYLAGPYKGAPLSLAIVVPARAGPFDLGPVTVRVAISVDPRSAAIHATSDPLPAIVKGVPLDLRSFSLEFDRPGFTRNPTSCDQMSVAADALSAGRSTALEDRFQVAECSRLGFAPRVSVRLLGPTHRGGHPGFRAVVTPRRGDGALRRIGLTLPATQLLDSHSVGAVCAASDFAGGDCPARSAYGRMKVWSPLLRRPLQGPVYLRSSSHRLPDLVASLDGAIHLDLVSRLDAVDGRLRDTFQALPDVPLSRAVLTIQGGRGGLLVNAGRFCAGQPRAEIELLSQAGKSRSLAPRLHGDCPQRSGHRRTARR